MKLGQKMEASRTWGTLRGESNLVWDFNAHRTLWGDYKDQNEAVIEELMEVKNLLCLNDGSSTRISTRDGTESPIDLTLVSDSLAGVCSWQVVKEIMVGSDHYLAWTETELKIERHGTRGVQKWCFGYNTG